MSVDAVVTGIGLIGPHGIGAKPLGAAFAAGMPLTAAIDRSDGYHRGRGSCLAALVPKMDLSRWVPPVQARRLGMPSRWAVGASRMALEQAGIAALDGRRTSIVLATAFGSARLTENLVRQILEEGPQSAQPFFFSECVANAAAGQTAIALGACGPNVTITQREAGPLIALARGAQDVREGRADVAIVGSVDEMTPLLHALLDRFGATARAHDRALELPRPFDQGRNGLLAGEGAAVLVIEREADAEMRGARAIARVAASGSAFDPTASASDWGKGYAALARSLAGMLARAGCPRDRIDRIVSGASGSLRGDQLEAEVLQAIWNGAALPPVLVPKAVVGEYGGSILAGAMLALEGAQFGRVAGFEVPDPEIAVTPHDGRPIDPPRCVLVSALAAGGAAAWIVLERP